jgi:trehalose/maltose hydrolase-like predicted phosphorylase
MKEGACMLKTMMEKMEKVLKGKLDKVKLKEKMEKHPDYILKAKEIWNMINEDLGISDKVENKVLPKVEKFEKIIIAKFPELTKEDVMELRKSIVGEINIGKDKVLNQVEHLKQLQIFSSKLKEENEKLKAELEKYQINDSLGSGEVFEEVSKIQKEDKLNEDNK